MNKFNDLVGFRTVSGRKNILNNSTSLDVPVGEEDNDLTLAGTIVDETSQQPFDDIIEREYNEALRNTLDKCMNTLTVKQQMILEHIYYKNMTLKAVGEAFNISGNMIRQYQYQALRRLATGKSIKLLKEYREEIISRYAYHSSFTSFKYTHTGSTENAALKLLELEHKDRYPELYEYYKNKIPS